MPMRIKEMPIGSYAWYLRRFSGTSGGKYGRVLDAALLWARSPRLFLGVAILYGMIDRRRSSIEPALRSLVTVRVSQINWCAFCVDLNSATLLKRGASPEKIEALGAWRHSVLFTERERTALDYAEAVTRSDARVEDGHFERLRAYFDDDAIVELTGLIAFQNLSSKFNSALAVPPQGFCSLPIVPNLVPPAESGHRNDRGARQPAEANQSAALSHENRGTSAPSSGAGHEDGIDSAGEALGIGVAGHPRSPRRGLRSR
jgi:AhpD family alkylhydroperoxidase